MPAEDAWDGRCQKPRLAIRKNLTSVTDTDFALASHLIEAMQEACVVRDVRGLINLEIEHHDSRIRILLECGSSILSARSLFPVAPEFLWRTVGTKEGLP